MDYCDHSRVWVGRLAWNSVTCQRCRVTWFEDLVYGSKLRVFSPWGHEGTIVAPDCVIHADKVAGVVHPTSLAGFAGEYPFVVAYRPNSRAEAEQIIARGWDSCGIPYQLIGSGVTAVNCEQAANFHQTGEATSPTLRGLAAIGLVGGALYFANTESPRRSTARSNPRIQRRQPRRRAR